MRTCGPGARYLESCPGESDEVEVCDAGVCHGWSSWSPWSSCSVTCGEGRRSRGRDCSPLTRGQTCDGEDSEEERCGQPCSAWSPWSPWSQCSTSCGPGRRTRERTCQGGPGSLARLGLLNSECPGAGQDREECSDQACPTSTTPTPTRGQYHTHSLQSPVWLEIIQISPLQVVTASKFHQDSSPLVDGRRPMSVSKNDGIDLSFVSSVWARRRTIY